MKKDKITNYKNTYWKAVEVTSWRALEQFIYVKKKDGEHYICDMISIELPNRVNIVIDKQCTKIEFEEPITREKFNREKCNALNILFNIGGI